MLSVAPWKYRNITTDRGGPIERLSFRASRDENNRRIVEAFAYLRPDLRPNWLNKQVYYGDVDGTGTAGSVVRASAKAVSEALERWAFYQECFSKRSEVFGFNIEPTTTGMAAFPGITTRGARISAFNEAAERWAIAAWWEGKLSARRLSTGSQYTSIALNIPFSDLQVVIVWAKSLGPIGAIYGFAANKSIPSAIAQATTEAERNCNALRRVAGMDSMERSPDLFERRMLYFASREGFSEFEECVERSLRSSLSATLTPVRLVDAEIPGPWSRFTTVWRVLFEMPSGAHLEDRQDYFYF